MTDYYPFGAVANTSWTRETAVGNPYLYNAGSELNEKTAWYETALRSYDPYLGRFNGVDVMADKYAGTTPFNYAFNSPAVLNDPIDAEPGQLIRTDDTPWEAPAYTRGKYQYYDNFAQWGAAHQWMQPYDGGFSSKGSAFARFGPGDGGALHSFMKGVLAGSRAARERRDNVGADNLYGEAWSATPENGWGIFGVESGSIAWWTNVTIDPSESNLLASTGLILGSSIENLWEEFWDGYLEQLDTPHPGKIDLSSAPNTLLSHLIKGIQYYVGTRTQIDLNSLFDNIKNSYRAGSHVRNNGKYTLNNEVVSIYYEIPFHGPTSGLIFDTFRYQTRYRANDTKFNIQWGGLGILLSLPSRYDKVMLEHLGL